MLNPKEIQNGEIPNSSAWAEGRSRPKNQPCAALAIRRRAWFDRLTTGRALLRLTLRSGFGPTG